NVWVRSGDVVQFRVGGVVRLSGNAYDSVGPGGTLNQYAAASSPLLYQPRGALIARIDNGQPFLIGNQSTVRMQADGQLFLGINDDYVVDNAGQFDVEITR